MAAYLETCLEEANGDAAFIAKALGDIARAKGMTQVARDAGPSRESLYKALSGLNYTQKRPKQTLKRFNTSLGKDHSRNRTQCNVHYGVLPAAPQPFA